MMKLPVSLLFLLISASATNAQGFRDFILGAEEISPLPGDFVPVVRDSSHPSYKANVGTLAPAHVANNSELSATAAVFPSVQRDGFAAVGDAPPLTFVPSVSACSLNAGAGDGGSQVPSSDGKCWLAVFGEGGADPRQWGADPSAVRDSTPALTKACVAVKRIVFAAGKYKFNSPVTCALSGTDTSLRIEGAGSEIATLYWPTGSGLTVNYNNVRQAVHIHDLTFSTGAAGTGTALKLQNTNLNGPFRQTDVNRVTFRGDDGGLATDYWQTAIQVIGVTMVNFDGDLFYGDSTGLNGAGITLQGDPATSPYYGVIYNVTNSTFITVGTSILYGSYVQGISIAASNFINGAHGVISNPAETGSLAQLSIVNSQFDMGYDAIVSNTNIGNIILTGNLFFLPAGHVGINLNTNYFFTIVGNQFMGKTAPAGNVGVSVGTTAANGVGTISGNTYFNIDTGNLLQAGSARTVVQGNAYQSVAANVSDLGTANIVADAIVPTAWTPTDGSGAALGLTVTDARYTRGQKTCTVSFDIVYPSTANASPAQINGLPCAAYNGTNSVGGGQLSFNNSGLNLSVTITNNGTTFLFYDQSGSPITNAQLSTKQIRGTLGYITK